MWKSSTYFQILARIFDNDKPKSNNSFDNKINGFIYITLDGNFSKTFGFNISLRRDRVPCCSLVFPSEQPNSINKSIKDLVVSIVFNGRLSLSPGLAGSFVKCAEDIESAAFA